MSQDKEKQLLLELIIEGLTKISDKVDTNSVDLNEKLNSISITLAVNTESLQQHMKRTQLLEDKLEKDVQPAVDFYNGLLFIGKAIGILALVVSIAAGLFEAAKFILEMK